MPQPGMHAREHAVVIGASIAGLLTARVLSARFAKVTLLDRDVLTPDTVFRRGAPQGHHPHYLLERGALAMEELFPGLRGELAADGAPIQDFGEAMRILLPYGWSPVARTGIGVQSVSRPFLEQRLRDRVLKLSNVELIGRFDVDGLVTAGTPTRVVGVRGRHDGQPRRITTDLVVDASGRGSRLPEWLEDIGIPRPPERIVKAQVTYASRLYDGHLENGFTSVFSLVYAPDRRKAGAVIGIEHGRCLVTMFGADGEKCATDEEAFAAFADQLPDPFAADYLAHHTPAGPIRRFIDHGNRWRLLHRHRGWPSGLVALGDTVCLFNPIYAQGMSVAALQALALGESLDRNESSQQFNRRAARVIRTPWLMATSADLAWERGGLRLLPRAAHWYLGRLLKRIPDDPGLYRRFAKVQHLRATPLTLLSPAVLGKATRPARSGDPS